MGVTTFNEMEIDAIGEIMNISLGASATAISTMLGTAVHITTPIVNVVDGRNFEFRKLEPAVGVEISYVEGLEGSNVMIFSRDDVRIIVGMMMGMEIPEEQFEMDEINRSAVCEVMNQMMGSSATALSEFLGYTVNISTPTSFEINTETEFKEKYFPNDEQRIAVRFSLEVEGKIKNEFLNIMAGNLAKKLLLPFAASFGGMMEEPEPEPVEPEPEIPSGGMMSQDAIEALMSSMGQSSAAPAPAPTPEPSGGILSQDAIEALMSSMGQGNDAPAPTPEPAAPASGGMMSQDAIEALMASMSQDEPQMQPQPQMQQPQMQPQMMPQMQMQPQMMPQMQMMPQQGPDPIMLQILNQMQQSQMQMMELMNDMRKSDKKKAAEPTQSSIIHPIKNSHLDAGSDGGAEEWVNQEMLMKVPLEVSVEIGRTKKLVKDILEYTQGSLVVLDKMAGEQADLYVNGRCIARGDIVVVEDNFGIRITEIVTRNLNPETL